MSDLLKLRVRYRSARFVKSANPAEAADSDQTFEQMIRALLSGEFGKDVTKRLAPFVEDERHSVCLHFSQLNEGALAFDLLHLDDRKEVPTWKRPPAPAPHSSFSGTKIAADEVSLQEPAYLLVSANHVAVIERVGLRTPTIEVYLNQLLAKSGLINDEDSYWKLVPKIEVSGSLALKGGVEKIVFKPHAALVGEAESKLNQSAGSKRRYSRKIDEYIGYGDKILKMLEVFGAHESDIEKLRKQMSQDLVLKAKVELSVSKAQRSSEAQISAEDVETAFAQIAETSDITVLDKDGKTNGKLVQLAHVVDVAHVNGIIEMPNAVSALSAAMASWAAKGVIELQ